jgi:hypothetical protein
MAVTILAPHARRIDVRGELFLHPLMADTGLTTCKTQWPALTCTCGWYTLVWPPPPRNGGEPSRMATER